MNEQPESRSPLDPIESELAAILHDALPADVDSVGPDDDGLRSVDHRGRSRRRFKAAGALAAVVVAGAAVPLSMQRRDAVIDTAGPVTTRPVSIPPTTRPSTVTTLATTTTVTGGSSTTTDSPDHTNPTDLATTTTLIGGPSTNLTTTTTNTVVIPPTTNGNPFDTTTSTNTSTLPHTVPIGDCGLVVEVLHSVTTGTILTTQKVTCILDAFASGQPKQFRMQTYNPPADAPATDRGNYAVDVVVQIDGPGAALVQEETHPASGSGTLRTLRCTQLDTTVGTTYPIGYDSCTLVGNM